MKTLTVSTSDIGHLAVFSMSVDYSLKEKSLLHWRGSCSMWTDDCDIVAHSEDELQCFYEPYIYIYIYTHTDDLLNGVGDCLLSTVIKITWYIIRKYLANFFNFQKPKLFIDLLRYTV